MMWNFTDKNVVVHDTNAGETHHSERKILRIVWISISSCLLWVIWFKFSEVLVTTFTVNSPTHITRCSHQLWKKTMGKMNMSDVDLMT